MDMPCEAHNMMENELSRIKDNQSELYSLDRQRQKEIADMTADVREIKAEQQTMKEDINELKIGMSEANTKITGLDNKVDKINIEMENVKAVTSSMNDKLTQFTAKAKWQPKDYCVVIVAVLSLIGVIVSAILSYIK